MAKDNAILQLQGVGKVFKGSGEGHTVLKNINQEFIAGTFTAIMGPSGSGKSTLLNCAAGLDKPTYGSVIIDGQSIADLSATDLAKFRREHIGFIFQLFNLMATLTVRENIALPLRLSNKPIDKTALDKVIAAVGLTERQHVLPHELSGGQQQRVAIARALFARPSILFGDEPTGALDTKTSRDILTLLRDAVDTYGQTVVMVTHDPVAASYADRVLFIADGEVVDEIVKPTADAVAKRMIRLGAWDKAPAKVA
ncbi:MAG TPA: ABC transporter ATP-binding protein [Verrucomicrobiae bacterium]|nr:ABC transporter ATP-binding protein [Verrucomicrobiae bacterium]